MNFNTPILEGELTQIKCRCQGDAAKNVMIISGEERNFRQILECLEVYGCLLECKIEKIFKYYTDNAEALQLAKNIDEAVVVKQQTYGQVKPC